jgi:AmmeMemoRadiSam system protein A
MFQLSETDQLLLLQIARESVRAHLVGESLHTTDVASGPVSEPRGAFVSIHKDSELRGCIGNVYPVHPLYRIVAECAVSAAVADPRFAPLTPRELPEVLFEISVLSPVERITSVADIVVGTHGLLINKRYARGLLLPQVATAYGWNREQFLAETCRKAGLGPEDWKDGAAIYRFTAFVFGEQRLHLTATS